MVKTPPTLWLDKSQMNLVIKELVGLAWLSIEQKQFEKDKWNERDASSNIAAKSKNKEAEEPQPVLNESIMKQGEKRLPCETPTDENKQPTSKKPCLDVVNNKPAAVPEHIVAAKALGSRLSGSSLKEYHFKGKPISKSSNKSDVGTRWPRSNCYSILLHPKILQWSVASCVVFKKRKISRVSE